MQKVHMLFEKNLKIALGHDDLQEEIDLAATEASYNIVLRLYVKLGTLCHSIVSTKTFNILIIFVILVAGVNIGVSTDPRTQYIPDLVYIVSWLDQIILYTFLVEALLKILAEKLKPLVSEFSRFVYS